MEEKPARGIIPKLLPIILLTAGIVLSSVAAVAMVLEHNHGETKQDVGLLRDNYATRLQLVAYVNKSMVYNSTKVHIGKEGVLARKLTRDIAIKIMVTLNGHVIKPDNWTCTIEKYVVIEPFRVKVSEQTLASCEQEIKLNLKHLRQKLIEAARELGVIIGDKESYIIKLNISFSSRNTKALLKPVIYLYADTPYTYKFRVANDNYTVIRNRAATHGEEQRIADIKPRLLFIIGTALVTISTPFIIRQYSSESSLETKIKNLNIIDATLTPGINAVIINVHEIRKIIELAQELSAPLFLDKKSCRICLVLRNSILLCSSAEEELGEICS